ELGGVDLERIFLVEVAKLLELGVTVEGVVVEGDLGVEGQEVAVSGLEKGVDLQEGGVDGLEGLVERLHEAHGLRQERPGDAQAEGELAGLEGLEPHG